MHSCSQRDDSFQKSVDKGSAKELGESAQRKKSAYPSKKLAYPSKKSQTSLHTVCTNKSLGFTFNTYTHL